MPIQFNKEVILQEIAEKEEDLRVFYEARELIRRRVLEVKDSKSQLTPLPMWSGTDAVLGSLDLSIHAMERTIMELKAALTMVPEPPKLTLIDGGQE